MRDGYTTALLNISMTDPISRRVHKSRPIIAEKYCITCDILLSLEIAVDQVIVCSLVLAVILTVNCSSVQQYKTSCGRGGHKSACLMKCRLSNASLMTPINAQYLSISHINWVACFVVSMKVAVTSLLQ